MFYSQNAMSLCASQKQTKHVLFIFTLIEILSIWVSAQQEGHDAILQSAFILYVFCRWITVV